MMKPNYKPFKRVRRVKKTDNEFECSTCEVQEKCETPFEGSICYKSEVDEVLKSFTKVSRGYVRSLGAGKVIIFYNTEYDQFSINHEQNHVSFKTVKSLINDLPDTYQIMKQSSMSKKESPSQKESFTQFVNPVATIDITE